MSVVILVFVVLFYLYIKEKKLKYLLIMVIYYCLGFKNLWASNVVQNSVVANIESF